MKHQHVRDCLSSAADGRQGIQDLIAQRFQAEDEARSAYLSERCARGRCQNCGVALGNGSTRGYCPTCRSAVGTAPRWRR